MAINWQYIGHVFIGTVITACQAVALADPVPSVVNYCHIISLVAVQLGVSLGVWQVSQVVQMRSQLSGPPQPPVLHHVAEKEPDK